MFVLNVNSVAFLKATVRELVQTSVYTILVRKLGREVVHIWVGALLGKKLVKRGSD